MPKPPEETNNPPKPDEASEDVSLDDVAALLEEMAADEEDAPADPPPAEVPEDKDEATPPPPAPAGPDLRELFAKPDAQQYMRGQFQTWLNELTEGQRQSAEAQEVQKLIDENNFEELGKRWATAESKRKVSTEVLEGFLDQTYRSIFADPAFQNLTPEDVQELRPENFKADADYIRHLSDFIARKRGAEGLDEKVEAKLQERLLSLKNEAKSKKNGAGAMGGAPPGDATKGDGKPADARQLISAGLRDAFKDYIPE